MNMTHYMELLMVNQPWNLLLFMGIPVVLAETLAITELYLLYNRNFTGRVRQINRLAGITVGIYFIGVILYLLINAVIPITQNDEWRTILDVIAVGSYLISGIPLILVALQDLGLIQKRLPEQKKLGWHVTYVAAFLVFGHIAMIAGMSDPSILGYQGTGGHDMAPMEMPEMPSHAHPAH